MLQIVLKLKVHKQLEMAQRAPPRTGLSHRESIADLVKDLDLLRVDTNGYQDTKDSMVRARDLRIEELKKSNGTLLEVCFSYVHKKVTILKSRASIIRASLRLQFEND